MKNLMNLALISLAFLFLFFLDVKAQCVQCLPSLSNPNILSCQSASAGGRECVGGGETCTVGGACPGQGGGGGNPFPEGFGNIFTSPKECSDRRIAHVEIDDDTIRAIGEQFPRAAIALGYARKSGLLGSDKVTTTMLPIEIDATVYTLWLERALKRPVLGSDKYEALFSRPLAFKSIRQDHGLIAYIFDLVVSESGEKVIRMQPSNQLLSDPSFRSLELSLFEIGQLGESSGTASSWKVNSWHVQ